MITVDVSTAGLTAKITRLREVIKPKPLIEIMRPEGRLLGKVLVKYTQPFGTDKTAQQRGKTAVLRDYLRTYQSPDTEKGIRILAMEIARHARPGDQLHAQERVRRYLSSGDVTAFERMLRDMKIPIAYGKTADPSIHAARWKDGKLRKGPFQIVTRRGSASKLAKTASDKTGFAKAGWCGSMRDLGGDKDIPGWIKQHRAPGGAIVDAVGEYACRITLVNGVNYTDRVLSQSNKRAAIAEREGALVARIDMILREKLRRADRAGAIAA